MTLMPTIRGAPRGGHNDDQRTPAAGGPPGIRGPAQWRSDRRLPAGLGRKNLHRDDVALQQRSRPVHPARGRTRGVGGPSHGPRRLIATLESAETGWRAGAASGTVTGVADHADAVTGLR